MAKCSHSCKLHCGMSSKRRRTRGRGRGRGRGRTQRQRGGAQPQLNPAKTDFF
jgi:hypothetical protein